jgi:hypothetical protein
MSPGVNTNHFSFVARSVQMKFDVTAMHENPAMASEFKMVDDGSGSVQVSFFAKEKSTNLAIFFWRKILKLNFSP